MKHQPTLPETAFNDIEKLFIAESPPFLWPENQDSNFGALRKVLSDPLQDATDTLTVLWQELFLSTARLLLERWEEEMGLPANPQGWSVSKRLFVLKGRMERSPFTYDRRERLVWFFLSETVGEVVRFPYSGIPFTDDGIQLFNLDEVAPTNLGLQFSNVGLSFPTAGIPLSGNTLFAFVENNASFSYELRLLNTIVLDPALERELKWMTPAGITFSIVYVTEL